MSSLVLSTEILSISQLIVLIPFEFRHKLWCQQIRVPELSCGIICVILRLAILIQYRSVTDTHTDRQTHDDGIYRT